MTEDWRDTLLDAERLACRILEHDKSAPGFAVAVVRALIAKMPTEDAVTLVKRPTQLDPSALIG